MRWRINPDIVHQVREVVVMGGAFGYHGALGNVMPAAEANIFADPHAAEAVFNANWNKLTIVGLDITQQTVMSTVFLDALRNVNDAGRFVWDVSRFYEKFHVEEGVTGGIYAHDYSAAAFVVARELFTTRTGPVRVMTDGIAMGMTIQKPQSMRVPAMLYWDDRPAVDACVGVDANGVLELFA